MPAATETAAGQTAAQEHPGITRAESGRFRVDLRNGGHVEEIRQKYDRTLERAAGEF